MSEDCFNCGSSRLAFVNAKCSDRCQFQIPTEGVDQVDYAPYEVGIGGGDYIEFTYCMDCGIIQDGFPVEFNPEE